MAGLLYGSGLRLMECVRLRIKDIDFELAQITMRDAKGGKDRITMLPLNMSEPYVGQTLYQKPIETLSHGVKDVSTTMIYRHVLSKPGVGVKSPLD